MKWLKTRTKHAWGYSSWLYIPLYVKKTTRIDRKSIEESFIIPIEDENNNSDKFRGVEWDIINTRLVPNKHIEYANKKLISNIKYYKNQIEENEKRLDAINNLIGYGKKTDPDEEMAKKRSKKWNAIKKRRANKSPA